MWCAKQQGKFSSFREGLLMHHAQRSRNIRTFEQETFLKKHDNEIIGEEMKVKNFKKGINR